MLYLHPLFLFRSYTPPIIQQRIVDPRPRRAHRAGPRGEVKQRVPISWTAEFRHD